MKSSDILLDLESEFLHVWKLRDNTICVNYDGADTKDGMFLVHNFGEGSTFEEACNDYLAKIRGKTLVFGACSKNRREVKVLG